MLFISPIRCAENQGTLDDFANIFCVLLVTEYYKLALETIDQTIAFI